MTGSVFRGGYGWRFGVALIFFSFFFVFLLWYIDPAIIHSSNGINIHSYVANIRSPDSSSYADLLYRQLYILELTPEYLRGVAVAPGGWTRFAVTLSIYACRYPIAGALAITGLALFFCWIFASFIQGTGARRPFVLGFIPAFFIMTICAWYELGYFAFLLPVAGALGMAVCYQRLRSSSVLATGLWISALFWIAWYSTQWGCLLLLLFIAIHDLFNNRHRFAAIFIASAGNGALLYFAETRLIPMHMMTRWSDFTMLSGLPLAVIGFFPLAAVASAVVSRISRESGGKPGTIGAMVRLSILVCGTVAYTVWLCREPENRDTRTVARTYHHVINGQWEAILQEKTASFFADFPREAGMLQLFMIHAVDHALYRTGQIGDRLFAFPQAVFSYDPLLMLQSMYIHGYVNWIVALDLAMDLGMVNAAEKIAGEIMENMGPYPDIIYRRALVQIAKDNRDAAAVYLGRLARMPFYRVQARRLLRILENDAVLLAEPRIATMHANRDTVDYFFDNDVRCAVILRHLLQSNPGNKAAYDYLMTDCLINGRIEEAAMLATSAPAYGYTVLPRYWEEALCLHRSVNAPHPDSISFSGLRQETVDRFYRFTRAWIEIKDDPGAAAKLSSEFGDSYFYFSVFKYSAGKFRE